MRSRVSRLRGPWLQFRFERVRGRAPFFGCQVASGQVCGGATQSAPSNWNVEQGAGTATCLFPLICVRANAQAFGMAPSLNASPVDSQLWKLKFGVCQHCQRPDQLGCTNWGYWRAKTCQEGGYRVLSR